MNLTKTRISNKRHLTSISSPKHMMQCLTCGDINYKGVWYAPDSRFALLLDEEKDIFFHYTCPACAMEKEGTYEGILYINDIPTNLYDQIIDVIFHEAVKDYVENPQHRLLDFGDILDGYKVTTTSSSMARRIGQKIQTLFGTCEISSTFQKDVDSLQIVKVQFIASERF